MNVKTVWSRFKVWFWSEVDRKEAERVRLKMRKGKFVCPRCDADSFTLMTNPLFSTNRMSESRTKVIAACANGKVPCDMRYVFVSKDFGKTWDPYAPSN